MVGRLVQDQQVRFPAEGTGYLQALRLAAGEGRISVGSSICYAQGPPYGFDPLRPVVREIVEVTRLFGDGLGAVFTDQAAWYRADSSLGRRWASAQKQGQSGFASAVASEQGGPSPVKGLGQMLEEGG